MMSTIAEVLAGHAVRDPGAPAIVTSGLGTLSFGVLARHVRQIGAQLAAAGIGPSSRVGIALQRGPEAALLNVAISANATVVPINPNLPPAELREELKRIRLHALVVPGGSSLPSWVDEDETGLVLFKATKAASSFEEIALAPVNDVRRAAPSGQLTEQSWAAIFRTSGTTGPSKRVPVTHRKSDRDGAQDGALAGADARRPFRLHHADLLQRRLQGDAGGAASGRLQRGVARAGRRARHRAMAGRAAADLAHRLAGVPAGRRREARRVVPREPPPRRCDSSCRRPPIFPITPASS